MCRPLHAVSRVGALFLGLIALGCPSVVKQSTGGTGGESATSTTAIAATTSDATSSSATSGGGGAATAQVIAKVSAPWGIGVNATSLIFTSHDNNLIARIPLEGGPIVPLVTDQLGPTAVALSDGFAWIGCDGGLARVPLDAQGTPFFVSTFITHAVAVHAGTVYMSSGPNIVSIPVLGGAVQQIAPGSSFVEAIVVNDTSVYWTASGGQIQSAPVGGGPMITVASFPAAPFGIAIDSVYVYYSITAFGNGADGMIMRAPLDLSSPPEALAPAETQPGQLVLDGSTLFWVDHSGTVRTMPASGGTPTSLHAGGPGPNSIAVDATSVYWSNDIDGTINKIAR
jgi:hypothetical protein